MFPDYNFNVPKRVAKEKFLIKIKDFIQNRVKSFLFVKFSSNNQLCQANQYPLHENVGACPL